MILRANGLDVLKEYELKVTGGFAISPKDEPRILGTPSEASATPQYKRMVHHLMKELTPEHISELASNYHECLPRDNALEIMLADSIRELFLNAYYWGNNENATYPILATCYESELAKAVSITDSGGGFNLKRVLGKKEKGAHYWKKEGRGTNLLDRYPLKVAYIPPGNTGILIVPVT